MKIVWAIAITNYKEIIRERLLYGILVIAALFTAVSFFLATVSLDQNARVMQNTGVAAIHFMTLFICVFVATNSVHRDFERRALYFLFPKPISRTQYIFGKYLGFVLLTLTTLAILGGLFSVGAAFLSPSILPAVGVNLLFSFLEISLLLAVALLFASFTAPLNAALYTLALFVIGNGQSTIKNFVDKLDNNALTYITNGVYYLLPNLEKFNLREATLYDVRVPLAAIAWALFYWLVFTSLSLYLASRVMHKQEL